MATPTSAALIVQSDVFGGAERYLHMLYSEGGLSGHLYGHLPDWTGPSTDLGFGPKWSKRTLLAGMLRGPAERRRLAARLSSDHSFAHMQFKREQILFSESIAGQMPVLWTEHGTMTRSMRAALGARYARASRSVAAIVCVSEHVRSQIREIVPSSTRVEMIPNPVDTHKMSPPSPSSRLAARARLGVNPDSPLAVWVGRFDRNKRPAMAAEIARFWPGMLLMAGTGTESSRIEPSANVRLVGFVDPSDLYRAADVLLMTSNGAGEGMPYVLLEAAAHGVPAVVSEESPVLRDCALRAGGHAVPDSDLHAWADAMMQLVSHPVARRSARLWAEGHDVRRWLSSYRTLVAELH